MSELDLQITGEASKADVAPEPPKTFQTVSVTIKLEDDDDALAVASEIAKLGEVQQLNIFKQQANPFGGPSYY